MKMISTTGLILILILNCTTVKEGKSKPFHLDNISKRIKGEWEYVMSYDEKNSYQLIKENFDFPPPQMMIFSECNDSEEINFLPETIIELREQDVFQNIKLETYERNGSLIDKYYPISSFMKDSTQIEVMSFGLRRKDEFFILGVSADTLKILDNRVYQRGDIRLELLHHIYTAK
ncbi:hypothetical protein [Lewinella sp. LCG006]|uniref:hypothetical protein n=1 Tax=Lewinella sp. LCG006 TaxID=3231911 RepID=UPI0034614A34